MIAGESDIDGRSWGKADHTDGALSLDGKSHVHCSPPMKSERRTNAAARVRHAQECLDYYIFPHAVIGMPPTILLYAGKRRKWSRYRYDSLESLLPIIGAFRLGLMSGSWGA